MVVVSYCRGRPHLVLVNGLEGLSLPRNSATINWLAWHDLVVDWAVKLQRKTYNSHLRKLLIAYGEVYKRFQQSYDPWLILELCSCSISCEIMGEFDQIW